jgi:nucleoside phosphorylase
MGQVDVLIVTALKEEYEAARDAGLRGYADNSGIKAWGDRDPKTPMPYIIGNYVAAGGAYMSVALARPTRMGSTATSSLASSLVERLKPRCLAMCGVCAGNPADVALGDVIVAELAYAYDEGKRTEKGFQGDHRQIPLSEIWVRSAQDLSPTDLPSYGEASENEARIWLLARMYAKEDPRAHPARARYFPRNTWKEYILSLEKDGFLVRRGTKLSLTEKGRSFVHWALYDDVHGPEKLPFNVVVGPIASGNVVVKDGRTWEQLKQQGVRTVVGLEMEAAMIASTAHWLNIANWVVVKGVMDFADPRKDDRYKQFAARASAEVLFKLLALHIISVKSPHTLSASEDREYSGLSTGDTIIQEILLLQACVQELYQAESWREPLRTSERRLVLVQQRLEHLKQVMLHSKEKFNELFGEAAAADISSFATKMLPNYHRVSARMIRFLRAQAEEPEDLGAERRLVAYNYHNEWKELKRTLQNDPEIGLALTSPDQQTAQWYIFGFESLHHYQEYLTPTMASLPNPPSEVDQEILRQLMEGPIIFKELTLQGVRSNIGEVLINRLLTDGWAIHSEGTIKLTPLGRRLLEERIRHWEG